MLLRGEVMTLAPGTVIPPRVHYIATNTRAHFDVEIDHAVFDQVTWTTTHSDLHWGNVTGPELCVLDWESWGRAPAGYDTSILLCASLGAVCR